MKLKETICCHRTFSTAALAAAVGMMLTASVQAQTPIVKYTFNGTTTTTNAGTLGIPSSGTATGRGFASSGTDAASEATIGLYNGPGNSPAATNTDAGVSGLAGDFAFNTGGTSMGNSPGGGTVTSRFNAVNGQAANGTSAAAPANPSGVTAITITGWFKGSTVITGNARLLDESDSLATANGYLLYAPTAGSLAFQVNGVTATSAASYTATNAWTFFAATYDGTGTATFYIGSPTATASLVGSYALAGGAIRNSTGAFDVGNSEVGGGGTGYGRPYAGDLDDIAVYGSVLTPAQLQGVQAADLAGAPEPSEIVGLALGAALLGLASLRLRRSVPSTVSESA